VRGVVYMAKKKVKSIWKDVRTREAIKILHRPQGTDKAALIKLCFRLMRRVENLRKRVGQEEHYYEVLAEQNRKNCRDLENAEEANASLKEADKVQTATIRQLQEEKVAVWRRKDELIQEQSKTEQRKGEIEADRDFLRIQLDRMTRNLVGDERGEEG